MANVCYKLFEKKKEEGKFDSQLRQHRAVLRGAGSNLPLIKLSHDEGNGWLDGEFLDQMISRLDTHGSTTHTHTVKGFFFPIRFLISSQSFSSQGGEEKNVNKRNPIISASYFYIYTRKKSFELPSFWRRIIWKLPDVLCQYEISDCLLTLFDLTECCATTQVSVKLNTDNCVIDANVSIWTAGPIYKLGKSAKSQPRCWSDLSIRRVLGQKFFAFWECCGSTLIWLNSTPLFQVSRAQQTTNSFFSRQQAKNWNKESKLAKVFLCWRMTQQLDFWNTRQHVEGR